MAAAALAKERSRRVAAEATVVRLTAQLRALVPAARDCSCGAMAEVVSSVTGYDDLVAAVGPREEARDKTAAAGATGSTAPPDAGGHTNRLSGERDGDRSSAAGDSTSAPARRTSDSKEEADAASSRPAERRVAGARSDDTDSAGAGGGTRAGTGTAEGGDARRASAAPAMPLWKRTKDVLATAEGVVRQAVAAGIKPMRGKPPPRITCAATLDGTLCAAEDTADQVRLVLGDDTGSLHVWDIAADKRISTVKVHLSATTHLCVAGAGALATAAASDPVVRMLSLPFFSATFKLAGEHSADISSIACTPDGLTLVTASLDATVALWDVASGRCVDVLSGHTAAVSAVAATDDHVVSGSLDTSLKVFSLRTARCTATLYGHNGAITCVTIVAAGKSARVVSGSEDTSVRVWDLYSGKALFTLSGHTDVVNTLAVVGQGTRTLLAASACDGGALRVWDPVRGTCVSTMRHHTKPVRQVVPVPFGGHLVSIGDDKLMLVSPRDAALVRQRRLDEAITMVAHSREPPPAAVESMPAPAPGDDDGGAGDRADGGTDGDGSQDGLSSRFKR